MPLAEIPNEAYTHGAALDEITPVWRGLDRKASALRTPTFELGFLLEARAAEGLPS